MNKQLKELTILFVMVYLFMMSQSGVARGQALYDPPIWAEDLDAGERLGINKAKHAPAGHPQEWAYDLLGYRHVSGKEWTRQLKDKSGTANTTYVIYKKPVYAMAAGTVIACWRNAPDNEHAGVKDKNVDGRRIALGGNFLWIEEDDGDQVHYAHGIPGTIPARLCPHNGTLFPSPYAKDDDQMPAQSHVPVAQRARVTAGEFLMNVGNSGNSTEPHLHIHKIDGNGKMDGMGAARKFRFRRGLYSSWTDGGADLNDWHSYAGDPLPEAPVLIWPPQHLGSEYAKHGFKANAFQRMFLHLSNSGYQLSWLDTYSVGGESFMNFVWHPASTAWNALALRPEAEYQAAITKAEGKHPESIDEDRAAPVLVESSLQGQSIMYSAIFIKNKSGRWLARHGLTEAQHLDIEDRARRDGLSPVNVSVVSISGSRRYTVLYNDDDIGEWRIHSEVRESDFQKVFDAEKKENHYPIYVNAYMHSGVPFLCAIFAEKAGTREMAEHGMSSAAYQKAYIQNTGDGLLTRSVTSFDGAQRDHRYAAVWWKK